MGEREGGAELGAVVDATGVENWVLESTTVVLGGEVITISPLLLSLSNIAVTAVTLTLYSVLGSNPSRTTYP